jgi:hypothetical protein
MDTWDEPLDIGELAPAAGSSPTVQRQLAALIPGGAGPRRGVRDRMATEARHLWREYAFVDEWGVGAPRCAVASEPAFVVNGLDSPGPRETPASLSGPHV